MEIDKNIKEKKEIYSLFLNFIESPNDSEEEFKSLIEYLVKKDIIKNKNFKHELLFIISKVAENYHRTSNFLMNFEKLFHYLIYDLKVQILPLDLYKIFENNKLILLLFIEKGILVPDYSIMNLLFQKEDNKGFKYCHFLYTSIKPFIDEQIQSRIEAIIKQNYGEIDENYIEKCHLGENDSYICSLIRQDLVEEFIVYINRKNISLSHIIRSSIFETNSYLLDNRPTLIEYAAFFGSIQIFQFLKLNNVPLTFSLWIYAIHGNNPEIIHILEEIYTLKDDKYGIILKEAIKCHHNDIANYIIQNYIIKENENNLSEEFDSCIIESCNYNYLPNDILHFIFNPKNCCRFNISNICYYITTLTIPSFVTLIGKNAFNSCPSLKQVTIASSVKTIEYGAFSDCPSLTQISIPSSVTKFGSNVFEGVKTLEITGDITSIGYKMFNHCSSLMKLIIPPSVVSIDFYAFEGCSSLEEILIPSSVTSIGEHAFHGCISLTKIEIPSSVTTIKEFTFFYCSSLTDILIPSSVTSIENNAFDGCLSLTNLMIPSSVTSIGDNAFNNCSSLIQIQNFST